MCSCLRHESMWWMWGRKNRQPVVIKQQPWVPQHWHIHQTLPAPVPPTRSEKKKKKPGGGPRSCRDPSIRDTIPPKESSLPGGQRETAIFWLLILAHTEYEKRNRGSDVFVPITTISGWAFCKCNSPPHLANRQYVKGWPVLSKSMRGPKSVQLSCFLYQIIPTFPAQLLIHSHQRTLMDGWVSSLALFIFLHPHLPTPCNWAPTGYAMFCQTPTGLQGSEDLQMLG